MVTLFTTPKPFRGHFGVIQRNAIRSWTRLRPACEIIMFGDEEGTREIATELGCRHVPEVARNEFGMPLIASLFQEARARTAATHLAYSNADIILMDDFVDAIRRLAALADRFLMIGQRHGLDVTEPLDFSPHWQQRLCDRLQQHGLGFYRGMDYFAFPAQLWTEIPEGLAAGRAGWDAWPVYAARLQRAIVVDATPVVLAVHQSHDYSHHPDGMHGVYGGPETQRNLETLGGACNAFNFLDATHVLTRTELKIRCRSCYPLCVCKPRSF
jgi:hypothetical protein